MLPILLRKSFMDQRRHGGLCYLRLLKQVLESLAGVAVTGRGGGCGSRGFLGVRGGGGILFYCVANFVECAVILRVFGSDALGNGLGALELGAGVEESALFAAVQFHLAFRAFTVGIEAGGEDCATVGAPSAGHGADHTRGAGAELIGAGAILRGLAVVTVVAVAGFVFFFVLFGIAVSAMTVLSIHKRLRPSVLTDCN